MFIFALILLALALISGFLAFGSSKKAAQLAGASSSETLPGNSKYRLATIILAISAVVALAIASFYTNDEGQAKVLRSITGQVQGQVTEAGAGFHAPWQDVINYDIRNQQVVFAGNKSENDGDVQRSEVSIQDKEGVSADIDISVRYSIKPDAVANVYKQYGSQESFISKFIENDIRAGVRTVPTKFGTLELLNSRATVEKEITAYLEERWTDKGVLVDSVSLQEIRYPEEVQKRFADAQNARTEVEKAKAELEATEVSAQQKIVQAEAEAEANRKLAASLSGPILEQRRLDTLREVGKSGNLVIVPEDFGGMINLPAK